MFGHNSFSWVPFRAESMFLIKNSETHQGGVNTDDDCDGPNDDDCWSYEDDGWVAVLHRVTKMTTKLLLAPPIGQRYGMKSPLMRLHK